MKIAILAAGYGTRLYPVTQNIAKPLIPINNKPMMNYLMDKISLLSDKYYIKEVNIVTNNKFYTSFLEWKKKYKIKAEILNDGSNSPEEMLGAVKDMQFAIDSKNSDWLVLGGDNLFEDNLLEFIDFSLKNKPHSSIALYNVKTKKEASRFGIVLLNNRKRIVKLYEKPKIPSSTLAASCVYFFSKESLKLLEEFVSLKDKIDASGKYISWLADKSKVFGYTLKGKWIDIGHFDSLKLAEKEFKS